MSAQAPEISVVIPCWNVSPWLARCLDSVFAALPEGAEAIAVDDGSTDDTLAILRKRAESEPRLRVVPLAHRGVSAARNAALDLARGRLLFFVDPDDLVAPDYFSAMSAALDRDRADICVCAFSGSRLKGDYRFGSGEAIRAGYLPRVFGYSFDDVRAWYAGKPLFADREMASACRFVSEALLRAKSMTCVDRGLCTVTDRESGAMRSVPRDGARLCRNKLRLLAKRRELDEREGGSLGPLFEATCVLSALEMLAATVRGRLPRRDGFRFLREYLSDPFARSALRRFPLSLRRPAVAASVLALRLFA